MIAPLIALALGWGSEVVVQGTKSAVAEITFVVNLTSAQELAFDVNPQGQGLNEVVATYTTTGSPDAVHERLDYGVIGEGTIRLAGVDHLSIEVPDTMVAFKMEPKPVEVVAGR